MTLPFHPRWIGWVLAALTVLFVSTASTQTGIARDEMVYFGAGDTYADWWIGLVTFDHGAGKESITKSFGGPGATDHNREHPPLVKTLSGLSHRLFHGKLGMNELVAYRLPGALLWGLLVLLVFTFTLEIWGPLEATTASLLTLFLPRALFHASLACFDAPIAALWFASIYAYWRCLDGRRVPWLAGVVFGLALATKHNALLLPFALGGHYLYAGWLDGRWKGLVLYRWRVILSFLILAPLTLVAVWPWLWFDPYPHVKQWIEFHLNHVHYNFEYLGTNYNAPPFPWHVALVTTLFTVPVVTLVAAAIGGVVWFRKRHEVSDVLSQTATGRAPGVLLILSAIASIGPFVLGSTPIFGAEKHWMPALPSLCIAAGVGVAWVARVFAHGLLDRARIAVTSATVAVVVLAAAVESATALPNALTWYNALAGEAPGGADHGMNRQFWGVAARDALPVLAKVAGKKQMRVYSHDASPAWGYYQKLGLLPKNLPDAGPEQQGINGSQLAIVVHEKHFNRHDYMIWSSYGTVQPIAVIRVAGVPVVSIYRRPE